MTKAGVNGGKRRGKPPTEAAVTEESDERGVEEDLALVRHWLDSQSRWESDVSASAYDGVFGTLPTWIPPGINNEFIRIRTNLLGGSVCGERITRELALTWVDRYSKIGATDDDTYIPQEYFEVVGQLARWRYIVKLGCERGLRELGVPSAAFLGRKPGAIAPETQFLVRLRKKYPNERVDDLYRTLVAIAQSPSHPSLPRETPRLCRGGSRSLTFKGVHQRNFRS